MSPYGPFCLRRPAQLRASAPFDHSPISAYTLHQQTRLPGERPAVNLRQTTHDIIRLVEERSGFPVQVLEDPNLLVIAQVRMAHGVAE